MSPFFIMPTSVEKGAVSVVFPSVCPSVAYIANNSRTQRHNVPKFGKKVPHLRCDSLTHIVRHSSECQGLRTSNLIDGWKTTTRISHRRRDLQGQQSRSQGHVISLSRVGPIANKSKTDSRSITQIGRTVPTCYTAHQFQGQKVKGHGHRLTNADTQNVLYLPNGKA